MLSSHNVRCPFCDSLLGTIGKEEMWRANGYIWIPCNRTIAGYAEFSFLCHPETKELMSEEFIFPGVQLINTYIDYPDYALLLPPYRKRRGAMLVDMKGFRRQAILELEEPLNINLEDMDGLFALISSLIIFS